MNGATPASQLTMDLDSIIANEKAKKQQAAAAARKPSSSSSSGGRSRRAPASAAASSAMGSSRDRSGRDRPARGGGGAGAGGATSAAHAAALSTRTAVPGLIPATPTSTKISITNLDKGVTEADLKELYGRVGPVRSVQLFYDKAGRSLGSAHVVFAKSDDAVSAVKHYNKVTLDGRPMRIEMVVAHDTLASRIGPPPAERRPAPKAMPPPVAPRGASAGGVRSGSDGRRPPRARRAAGGGRRAGGGGGGGGGGGRGRTAPKSAADLDNDLDSYMAERGARPSTAAAAPGAAGGEAMQTD